MLKFMSARHPVLASALSSLILLSTYFTHATSLHQFRLHQLLPHHAGISREVPMPWDHFHVLRRRDARRAQWIFRKRRYSARDGRRLGETDFTLSGSADPTVSGLYWTKISLGSPPQIFSVQIDTGSDLLWVQCQPCTSCPTKSRLVKLGKPYDPSRSSTFQEVSCGEKVCSEFQYWESASRGGCNPKHSNDQNCYYQISYGDNSMSHGKLGQEFVTFPTQNGSNGHRDVLFGCGFNQVGNLVSGEHLVDGIMGLGMSSFAFPFQLSKDGSTPHQFAHCLGGETDGGGFLYFGALQVSGAIFTPFADSGGMSQYYVNVESIKVNGSTLQGVNKTTFGTGAEGRGTIFDSGTSLSMIPDAAYFAITQKLTSICPLQLLPFAQTSDQFCWLYTGEKFSELHRYFPEIEIQFESASMILTPENYILILSSTSGVFSAACFAWQPTSSLKLTVSIFGDIALRNKLVIYDIANKRIGWVNANCSDTNDDPK